MQVIPLILTDEALANDNFEIPTRLTVDTHQSYGNMGFKNESKEKPCIVPASAMVLSKQRAQDHAMVKVGLVQANDHRVFRDACCVQDTQGGHLNNVQGRDIQILPYALRETALRMTGEQSYNKLWPAIRKFNAEANVSGNTGWLVAFQTKYATVLDQFVAEFECVPNQVGALVLIGGNLMGVERAPNQDYWLSVWEPLIRMCYGSHAVMQSVGKSKDAEPTSANAAYDLLQDDIGNLDELEAAVDRCLGQAEESARAIVRDLLDDTFKAKIDDSMKVFREGRHTEIKVWHLEHDQLVGQSVTDDGTVAYASLTAKAGWARKRAARKAPAFSL
jgi:hypothetical protein